MNQLFVLDLLMTEDLFDFDDTTQRSFMEAD